MLRGRRFGLVRRPLMVGRSLSRLTRSEGGLHGKEECWIWRDMMIAKKLSVPLPSFTQS